MSVIIVRHKVRLVWEQWNPEDPDNAEIAYGSDGRPLFRVWHEFDPNVRKIWVAPVSKPGQESSIWRIKKMCIYPQYRVNRLLDSLQQQRNKVARSLARARRDDTLIALNASLTTLDFCIAQIREAADKKQRVAA